MARTTIVHLLTTEQAKAFVKKVDRTNSGSFAIVVKLDAAIAGDETHVFPNALSGYISLSRKEALRLVSTMLSPTIEGKGGRIRLEEVRFNECDKPCYWL